MEILKRLLKVSIFEIIKIKIQVDSEPLKEVSVAYQSFKTRKRKGALEKTCWKAPRRGDENVFWFACFKAKKGDI